MGHARHRRLMRRLAPPALAALVLGACSHPKPAPAPAAPAAAALKPARPQFTFVSWTQAQRYIREGRVIQTVSGRGGFSLVLVDHTWLHLVAKPGDPLPKNPRDYISRYAPNAQSIHHTTE